MSEKDKLVEQYVEQYNDLCEALGIVKPKAILEACVVLDKIVELAKAEATNWHYPSKGEYPTEGESVLVAFQEGGFWYFANAEYHEGGWASSVVDLGNIVAWQYIVPPKEEA